MLINILACNPFITLAKITNKLYMKTIITIAFLLATIFTGYSQGETKTRMPGLSEDAPSFSAKSTMGDINFPADYYGKWKIIFSHPAAFTPVCTTELLELAYLQDEFAKMNTEIIVLSTDGLNSHIEWTKSMEEINYFDRGKVKIKYPIIADNGYVVSRKYGMIHPNSSSTKDVRAVFMIDPENKIQSVFVYPSEVGRNIDEILRTLKALQKVENKDILTPANWNPGDDYLVMSPKSIKEAEKMELKKKGDMYSLAWYLWYKEDN